MQPALAPALGVFLRLPTHSANACCVATRCNAVQRVAQRVSMRRASRAARVSIFYSQCVRSAWVIVIGRYTMVTDALPPPPIRFWPEICHEAPRSATKRHEAPRTDVHNDSGISEIPKLLRFKYSLGNSSIGATQSFPKLPRLKYSLGNTCI